MDNKKIRKTTDQVIGSILYPEEYPNIAKSERILSAAFGTFMFWRGAKDLFSNPSNGVWELIIGSALIYRGATGYCALKDKFERYGCGPENSDAQATEYVIEAL